MEAFGSDPGQICQVLSIKFYWMRPKPIHVHNIYILCISLSYASVRQRAAIETVWLTKSEVFPSDSSRKNWPNLTLNHFQGTREVRKRCQRIEHVFLSLNWCSNPSRRTCNLRNLRHWAHWLKVTWPVKKRGWGLNSYLSHFKDPGLFQYGIVLSDSSALIATFMKFDSVTLPRYLTKYFWVCLCGTFWRDLHSTSRVKQVTFWPRWSPLLWLLSRNCRPFPPDTLLTLRLRLWSASSAFYFSGLRDSTPAFLQDRWWDSQSPYVWANILQ